MIRPQFKPHLHAEIVAGEGLFLISEQEQTVLRGRSYEMVGAWVDGRRTVDDIAEQLRGQLTAEQVARVLNRLEEKGYLGEADESGNMPEAAYWGLQGIEASAAAQRLQATAVAVTAVGAVAVGPLVEMLKSLRVRLGEPANLGIVLTDDYLRSDLAGYNRDAVARGQPWLLAKPVGCQVWIGPLFRPGTTGCWECLAQRNRGHRRIEGYLQGKKGWPEPFPASWGQNPVSFQVACGLTATAVADFLTKGELPELEGKVWTLDLNTRESHTHTLVRRPQCPVCGTALPLDTTHPPVCLQSRQKTFVKEGGHRVMRPEETFRRFEHQISPIIGAVSEVYRSSGDTDGIMHVFFSGENLARRSLNLDGMAKDLRSGSAGKGVTDLQSKASALCEALERYSGYFQGDEPRRRASMRDLGDLAIHPNACMGYSEQQYRERERWNGRRSHYCRVPAPFDEGATVDWSPVWSLTHQSVRYLPTAFCYFAHPESSCYVPTSNGNAAGNNLEEAILQGFLELVERDAVALWWYNRLSRPGVCLESFGEPYLLELRDYFHRGGREIWALDLTSDLGIPVFVSLTSRKGPAEDRILFGLGAHFDARLALLRAVTEMNQVMTHLWSESGEMPDLTSIEDPIALHWLKTATLANQPYLSADARVPVKTARDYRPWTSTDVKEDILACQALVEQRGMEMLVLDQTRPDIGLAVAKVIVPGLRHFWTRFAPGRLYDVPVQLGWLPAPLAEDQLNEHPMFI